MFKEIVGAAVLSIALMLPVAAQVQYVQQGNKLVGSGYIFPSSEGSSVALSADGNTALISGPLDNAQVGAVWVFTRSDGVWTQQGDKLTGGGENGAAQFGASVALSADGNTALIGGPIDTNAPGGNTSSGVGAAWVFTRSNGVWTQQGGKLLATDSVDYPRFGFSVALSADGNTALIGGPNDNSYPIIGAMWVFIRSNGVWTQQGKKLVAAGTSFGLSVALSADGNTAIGSDLGGGPLGEATIARGFVFTRSNGVWTQQGGMLNGVDSVPSGGIPSTPQGAAVALSGDGNTALIGGDWDSTGQGAVWVFTRSNGVWAQQSKMVGAGNFGASTEGRSVALSTDGNTAVWGGPGDMGPDYNVVGAAWISTFTNGVWTQQGGKVVGFDLDVRGFGSSVAVSADGSTVLIGAPGDNGVGSAWIYVSPAVVLGASSMVMSSAAGSSSIIVGTNPPGAPLSWTLGTTAPWIQLGMSDGMGGALVPFTYDANAGPARTGTLSLNNGLATLTVTQAGSAYVPASQMSSPVSSGLNSPSGVAVDASGNVYIADTLNNAVNKWTSATQQLTVLISSGLTPRGIAVDAAGNVYLADTQGNMIWKWESNTQWGIWVVSSGLNSPSGVAVDGSGNLYIADTQNNAIKEWSANTHLVTTLVGSGLNQPNGVAVDASGNVYIADTKNNAIKKWTATTQLVTTVVGSGLNLPGGVAVDGFGNLYIADTQNNAIKEWSATTQLIATLLGSGLNHPNGVAVDSAGNVYIADTGNNAIKVIWSAYLDASTITLPAGAGSGSLPPVLPLTVPLNAQSDQTWLTITSQVNGVVSYSYTANPGSTSRTADISLLGLSITVTQAGIVIPPTLAISETHYGSFEQGQQNATYIVTVSNAANAGPTSGTVTVAETTPSGLTLLSMAGGGWTCPGTASNNCTRGDPLNAGAGYSPITVTVNVASNASSPQVNAVSVSGGGSATANASDPTTITTATYVSCVRDFLGIGRSDALIYDPVSGTAYTALSNGNGTYQYVYNLFTPAFDTLRTGDFTGNGKADLVLYNSHTALAYIGMSNGDGTFAFQSVFWSPGYDFVETGDLNGDGLTDFALYNSSTGTLYTGISNGNSTFTYKYTLISTRYTFLRLADFTGDGKADLFVYNAATGAAYLGVGDGTGGFAFNPLFISPGYDLADVGDLNGDGKADLILYNSGNGNTATGISDGAGGFNFTPLIFSPGFTSVRLADYTGDGKADVSVYNKTTAAAYFGTGTGSGAFNFQSLFWSPGYDAVEPQDANGDGKIDVVLYNSTTGTEYTGLSNGDGTFTYTYWYWGTGKMLAR